MHSNSGKYAYYFDGSAWVEMDYISLLREGDSVSLDIVPVGSQGATHACVLNHATGVAAYLMLLNGNSLQLRMGSAQSSLYGLTRNERAVVDIQRTATGYDVFVDGERRITLDSTETFRVNLIGYRATSQLWIGWIYCMRINGKAVDLQDLPSVWFHNVTRYELDENDEIIESTAKVLNTLH